MKEQGTWHKPFSRIYGDDFKPDRRRNSSRSYPHVIFRAMPAVYPAIPMKPRAWRELTQKVIDDLVERVKTASRVTGARMCVMLGPKNCIYVKPDGTTDRSSEPPYGPVIEGHTVQFATKV